MQKRLFPLALTIALATAGCASIGPNALVAPVVTKASQTLSYATDKAFRQEPAKIDHEAILAKAKESCASRQLTEAECGKVMAKAQWAIDLTEKVQGLDTVAQAQRDAEFKASWRPENLARDVAGGAVGQATMLQSASLQAQLSPAGAVAAR
jgi:hypothetical protein